MELEKEQKNPKTSRSKEIIKIRAEINAIETNKQKNTPIEQINDTGSWFFGGKKKKSIKLIHL